MEELVGRVAACLQGVLSPATVVQAEQHLATLEQQQGYGVALAHLAVQGAPGLGEQGEPVRQLAAVALRRYVTAHWADPDDEDFVPPQVSPEDKQAIRSLLPSALADPQSKISTAAVARQRLWN